MRRVLHPLLISLFGLILAACAPETEPTGTADVDLTLAPGFEAELIHTPTEEQGSWVALTTDGRGRLIASDQYGGLYRITPPPIGGSPEETRVDSLPVRIGRANGLLWAFNSLYVVVNDSEGESGYASGLYRVLDTDGDDRLDTVQPLKSLDGGGEHGPHGIVLGPDGASLYVIAGNHTDPPEDAGSLLPPTWAVDGLLPTILDARGHAFDRTPPGGWIARTDSLGRAWTLVSTGYRNAYDLAFNQAGDLFTFDSDMEWDLGMPWYRPIRVCHAVGGSEFGWRTGSGKWSPDYPDNLPPVVKVGQGSPTGVLAGTGAAFPARYQHGLYVFDWSFGTIYFVDLEPRGASYTATIEEFLSGAPLPLTDGVIGPDGALYFATGGRRLESHLYRVIYTGEESTEATPAPVVENEERSLRLTLERYHGRTDPAALDAAWPHLNHPDRFVRYAARVAVENQPAGDWAARALQEADPIRRMYAVLALARSSDDVPASALLDALADVAWENLDEARRIDLLRTYAVVLARRGALAEPARAALVERFTPLFPAEDARITVELAHLLAFLDAPGLVEKALPLLADDAPAADPGVALISREVTERSEQYGPIIAEMLENLPSRRAIDLAHSLTLVTAGWTPESRRTYFEWYLDALGRSGGESYRGFLDEMRRRALEHVPDEERAALADLTGAVSPAIDLADLPRPEGPGRNWNRGELGRLAREREDEPRSFARGLRTYDAALCRACHTMRGRGGNNGPDLTQVGTRYGRGDLIEAILSPSRDISSQYAAEQITLADGSTIVGRVLAEDADSLSVNRNPYDPDEVHRIALADVRSRAPSPVSVMPPGLLNPLNEDEALDLLAFLMAGGDSTHAVYR